MYKKLYTIFFIIVLLIPVFYANASTPTSLSLQKYVGDTYEVGKEVQFSARLLDDSQNWLSNKPVNLYYKIGSTGNWVLIDTRYTDAIGYASFTFVAGSTGAYIFRANFTGTTEYEPSISNEVSITFVLPQTTTTTTPPPQQIEGWGTVQPYGFTANLISYEGDWQTLKPLEICSKNSNVSAIFSYTINPCSQFDIMIYHNVHEDQLQPYRESWFNRTIEVYNGKAKVVIQDLWHTKVDWWAFGSILGWNVQFSRIIRTKTPNGTIFDFDASTTWDKPLRLIAYRDERGYLIFAWTQAYWYSEPITNVPTLHNNQITAWNLGDDFNLNIKFYVKMEHKNVKRQFDKIEVVKCKMSNDVIKVYTLLVQEEQAIEYLGSQPAFKGYYDAVAQRIDTWKRNLPSWVVNALNSIGMGWLVDIIVYISEGLKLLFNVVYMTLPYIGIIFLIINLKYIATLDFGGLFEFYITIYQIVANMFSAVVGVVNWIIDGFKGLLDMIG